MKKIFFWVLVGLMVVACGRKQPSQQEQRRERAGVQEWETETGQGFMEKKQGLDLEMVYVEGGSFIMGGTPEQDRVAGLDELPFHEVTLRDFYIGRYEVTQAQWEKVMGTTVRGQRDKADKSWGLGGEGPDYPMYYVSWEEAKAFCEELSRKTGKRYTLPTEAQWEYAARGGLAAEYQVRYSGSDSAQEVAWCNFNSENTAHEVGLLAPNDLGLYDMSGNVWEWCSDIYGEYSAYGETDPQGAPSGDRYVARGGCWAVGPGYARVSARHGDHPDARYSFLGFRVVLLP